MSHHTPGPWSTGTDEDAHMVYDDQLQPVANTLREDGNGYAEADNAKLCAAAPDLLEAAKAGSRYSDELRKHQFAGEAGQFVDTARLDVLFEDWHNKTHAALDKIPDWNATRTTV